MSARPRTSIRARTQVQAAGPSAAHWLNCRSCALKPWPVWLFTRYMRPTRAARRCPPI